MTTKADPKPGRWILPLIIIGMVAFTYVFVGNITENTEPIDLSLDLGADEDETPTDDTLDDGTPASTTTTVATGVVVDAESTAYLDRIADLNTQLTDLSNTMIVTNNDFDDRTIEYSAARNRVRDEINPDFASWAADVAASVPPESNVELVALNTELTALATAASQAAADVLAGLESSDEGEARAAALTDLANQVSTFNAAVEAANS